MLAAHDLGNVGRMRQAAALLLLLAVAAVVVAIVLSTSNGTRHRVAGSSSREFSAAVDQKDPNQAGCSPTAVPLGGSATVVHDPAGGVAGTVLLRYSTACQAMWGRVEGLEGHGRYLVEIDVHRPSDGATARFHVRDTRTIVFGNMLSARSGCVYAVAWLTQGQKRGGLSRTPCMMQPSSGAPPRSSPTIAGQGQVKPRTEVADVRAGIVLYRDIHGTPANAADIPIGKRVLVICKAPNHSGIASINLFYLIATSPWRDLFASANQFANGAAVGVTTNSDPVDPRLRNCTDR